MSDGHHTRSRAARDEEMRHIGGRAGDWVNASIEGHLHATPDRAANADTREAVANAISHEFAYDVGFGFVAQMADRLLAALDAEGWKVVPK